MAKRPKPNGRGRKGRELQVEDYRHEEARRKNNPPAKIAAEGTVPAVPKARYSYDPHLPPVLRFDPTGKADRLPELLAEAKRRPLSDDEAHLLAEALRTHEPWLEWSGKREQKGFEVDPVALHIHERISAQAILRVARRQDVARTLFADPEQDYREAVQFYLHDIDWTNRLILGDSLQVMSSLARREDLAGKVQMIYIDPPYGIRFASNFQPEVGQRDVKDTQNDLTREPEMVRAYRDTWHLGIHSYMSYLRDRVALARELLADTGSLFIQISDENLHRVRNILDEIFGSKNYVGVIQFQKTTTATNVFLPIVCDYLLWYARDRDSTKYHPLYLDKTLGERGAAHYSLVEMPSGERRRVFPNEVIPVGARPFSPDNLTSASLGRDKGEGAACWFPIDHDGVTYTPNIRNRWKTNEEGMKRLMWAGRVLPQETTFRYARFFDDFPAFPLNSMWTDVGGAADRMYVVQTSTKIVQRCMAMTTDPGDLVLDPTCGSGTTACVAEQWGRRWITIDTSRVAIAIARQRLLTAAFDRYRVKGEDENGNGNGNDRLGVDPHPGFICKTVSHITLKSIAQNQNLDPIFAKHEPILDARLADCNRALKKVTREVRQTLEARLVAKENREGKKAVTDADRRRWLVPSAARKMGTGTISEKSVGNGASPRFPEWNHWEVPFDTDPAWPKELIEAVKAYRKAWRAKMDEVNACIAANAEQEELVDQPEVVKRIVRVSGPFTVEAVQPPELTLDEPQAVEGKFDGEPEELPERFAAYVVPFAETQNVEAYLDQMVRLLRGDGVRFPNNKQMRFTRLEPLYRAGCASGLHAAGRWAPEGEEDKDPDGPNTVCVVFGPQYGPVTAKMVEEIIRPAHREYDDLVVAGFSFDGPSQAVIEEAQHPKLRIHMAHIRPDVNPAMNGLLKEQPGSQLFSVFGQPRTSVKGPDKGGEYTVTMEGVDIYNPVENTITATGADKVAAWFLDSDYDGRTFCITQAFFPDRSAWEKLSRALKGVVDPERFEALSGTVSLPFPAGKHKCVAVKVIDPRGNEVMKVHTIPEGRGKGE